MDTGQAAIYDDLWTRLEQGSADRRHPFHTPVLATRGESGDPDLRTVVLRRVDRALRVICCHTDSRAPKVREIQSSERVAWLFYEPASGVQIRAHGRCTVHSGAEDAIACETWRGVHPDSRVCYAAPHAPSCELQQWESNQSPNAREIALTQPTSVDVPPDTFAVLATVLDSIEWLDLHHDGHQRVRFTLSDSASPSAQWLAP
jgi:pyridoxamine 5'-phosphate oxidase